MVIMNRFVVLSALALAVISGGNATRIAPPSVSLIRVPAGGIQPQVVEQNGIVHLLYFSGEPEHGDLNYVRSRDYGRTFSKPIRVNSEPGSAMAMGNIRGGQIALGANGRVHVAWIGSGTAQPRGASNSAPVLYTRLNDAGTAFEPERGVSQLSWGTDGSSVAADSTNHVYVFWHAQPPGGKAEDTRRVWMARSSDGGRTFAGEAPVNDVTTGVCGCCGMRALADADGTIHVLYRSARETVHRDMFLLTSKDQGRTFQGAKISGWNIGACVMSSDSFAQTADGTLAAWESEKQVYFGRAASGAVPAPISAPGTGENRKYPWLAVNSRGEILLAWTEHMAWRKGGSVAWQVHDRDLKPQGPAGGTDGVPAWSLVAAFARPDGGFTVIY
jgi:hypothetical protein